MDYYDVILALMPVSLFGIAGGLVVAGFATTYAIMAGAVASIGLMGHALFVNAPVEPSEDSPSHAQSSPQRDVSAPGAD